MCWPLAVMAPYLAAAGAAASAGGAVYSAAQQSRAANAQIDAMNTANTAQNAAFFQRNAAQTAANASQFQVQNQAIGQQQAAAQQTYAGQQAALQNQNDVINRTNAQEAALRQTGAGAAQDLMTQTNAPALTQSQTDAQAQQASLLAPTTAGIQASNPLGGADDPATKEAVAASMALAAARVRGFGADLAKAQSYQQPLSSIGLAISGNQTGIMPAQVADQLLRSGTAARLLPAQMQFSDLGSYGQGVQQALQSQEQNNLGIAGSLYGNTVGLANLGQSDTDVVAQNAAKIAQANAAYNQQWGQLAQGIGNLGLYGAGRGGLGSSYFTSPNTASLSNFQFT